MNVHLEQRLSEAETITEDTEEVCLVGHPF